MPSGSSRGRSMNRPSSTVMKKIVLYSVVAIIIVVGVVVTVLAVTLGGDEGLKLIPEAKNDTIVFRRGHFKTSVNSPYNWQQMVSELNGFFAVYPKSQNLSSYDQLTRCSYNDRHPPEGKSCFFDSASLHWRCSQTYSYGYESGKPCVILYPEKKWGWEPEYFLSTKELPEDIPTDLREHIRELEAKDPSLLRTLWLWCGGENDEDRRHLGPVHYSPQRGFPGYYFPYRGQKSYISPLVGVDFRNPQIGIPIHIRCQLWAKNIPSNYGFVRFRLLVQ